MNAGRPRQRPSPRGADGCVAAAALLLFVPLLASPARAAQVDGSASVTSTSTDSAGEESRALEQQYTLNLYQPLTPYVSVLFGFQYYDFGSDFEDGTELMRRNREPTLDFVYGRNRLSARFSLRQRASDSSVATENFESRSLAASLSWSPLRGPGFRASFRDESNVADVALVGPDTSSQYLTLETFLNRDWGGASYRFHRSNLDSRSSGFDSRQNRHEVRGWSRKDLLEDRLSLNFSASLSRVDRKTAISEGAGIVEVVHAREGLYAVDTTPEIGELAPAPDLLDGDTATPAAPGIDIGGANTLRNIGLDLGISAQVTRLEITVNTVSGPAVLWQVYHSPDNLTWERVGAEASDFDPTFLRYTIRFPLATDRYLKAVNVSANPEPSVLVTELRALLDRSEVDPTQELQRIDQSLYRADVSAIIRPTERITGRLEAGYSNDQDIVEGLTRRDFNTAHAGARVNVALASDLHFALGYRWDDFEDRRPPMLQRTTQLTDGSLRWTPMDTLEAALVVQRREESQRSEPIQSSRTARLLLAMQLLPDLRLVSEAAFNRLNDPFSGFERSGWTWSQGVEARPVPRWSVQLRFGASDYRTPEGDPVLKRSDVEIQSTWTASAYLTLFGSWSLHREDLEQAGKDSIRQNYGFSYAPGPRLRLSAAYQEYSTLEELATTGSNVNLGYRLGRYATVFGTLSRSRTRISGIETASVLSSRVGLRLFF